MKGSMDTEQLHIGIIGAERIGRVHSGTLAFRLPDAKVVAITDVNRQAAQEVNA